jgi:sirohydrochlorin cobaltochelatase
MNPDNGSTILPTDAGVLLIGHGTRDEEGHAEFLRLGELLAKAVAPTPVEVSLLELQPPTIEEGWERLVSVGTGRVLAAPLLLFAAGHAKSDIPDALTGCQARLPVRGWAQSRPLSRAPELIELIVRRWDEAIAAASADPQRTAVIVVGRGSHDPCAQADLRVLTACAAAHRPVRVAAHRPVRVAAHRPVRVAATAYYAMAQPKLDEVIAQVTRDPQVRDVIIQPHLLFQGAIHRSIRQQVEAAASEYPRHRLSCADYLGPDPLVVASLVRRVREAIGDTPIPSATASPAG